MNNSSGAIYAIYDNVAQCIVGVLMVFKHVAAAIRQFNDIASMGNNQISEHPEDFDLIELGVLNDRAEIIPTPSRTVIMTGKLWKMNRDAASRVQPTTQIELLKETQNNA